MKRPPSILVTFAMLVFALVAMPSRHAHATAALGAEFTYQGELKQAGELVNDLVDLEFSLWTGVAGGSQVGPTIPKPGVSVVDGRFTVTLDFGAQSFDNFMSWLEIVVDGTPLTPRQAITRAPYATQTRGIFVDDDFHVGIGTTLPDFEATLHIQDNIGDNFGVLVDSFGVAGSSIGLHAGPLGYSSLIKNAFFEPGWKRFDDNMGAFLQEVDPQGNVSFFTIGPGASFIPWSNPLFLANDGDVGVGTTNTIARLTVLDLAKTAVRGESLNATAIFGRHAGNTGQFSGVHGETESNNSQAYGVHGVALNQSSGLSAAGVRGQNLGTNFGGYGVDGSHAGTGTGVRGTSVNGIGVVGHATALTGTNYGVFGTSNSPDGWAGYFSGDGYFSGSLGVGTQDPAAKIHVVGGTDSALASGGYLVLGATNSSNISIDNNEIMARNNGAFSTLVLNADGGNVTFFQNVGGNVGLGVSNPTFQLQLSANSATKPTSSVWTISSDRRLKKNIHPIDDALEQLMQLQGVTYQWIHPEDQGNMTGTYTGMVAQDVEKVFPEWITTGADGYKRLTVIGFEALTVEALRELRREKDSQVDELRAANASLHAENQSLKDRLDALEKTVAALSHEVKGATR